jgi:hypothetical protein
MLDIAAHTRKHKNTLPLLMSKLHRVRAASRVLKTKDAVIITSTWAACLPSSGSVLNMIVSRLSLEIEFSSQLSTCFPGRTLSQFNSPMRSQQGQSGLPHLAMQAKAGDMSLNCLVLRKVRSRSLTPAYLTKRSSSASYSLNTVLCRMALTFSSA